MPSARTRRAQCSGRDPRREYSPQWIVPQSDPLDHRGMRLLRALFALVSATAAVLLVLLAVYVTYVAWLWNRARQADSGPLSTRHGHLPRV